MFSMLRPTLLRSAAAGGADGNSYPRFTVFAGLHHVTVGDKRRSAERRMRTLVPIRRPITVAHAAFVISGLTTNRTASP
jgi:hypothetical protein